MTKAERLERDIAKLAEMKAHEDELRAEGYRYVAGIDEVGRGPLAGPVYAACVILPEDFDVPGVNDSKKLSAKRREELSDIIKDRAVAWGLGIADNKEIDELNILEATKTAMKRAIAAVRDMLSERGLLNESGSSAAEAAGRDILLIDAVKLDAGMPAESIIKGDEKCLCIAAASIVAKVARDAYMTEMDSVYPGYDFAGNKGYGTAKHYEGLRTLGKTPIHRLTFLKKFDENPETGHIKHDGASGAPAGGDISMAKKVYAVRKGRTTGIFMSWDDCKAQVDGFAGAEYKSFADPSDAMEYLGLKAGADTADGAAEKLTKRTVPGVNSVRAYVDGSFDAANGRFSCGVVMVMTDADGNSETAEFNAAFDDEEAAKQRNVAGEVMGSRLAIEYCLKNSINKVEIYHDYEGIGAWADRRWKANNPLTQGYRDFVAEARQNMEISFVKVKAHSGNKYNEIADKLAKKALSE